MNKIEICMDTVAFKQKPEKAEIGRISKRIAEHGVRLSLCGFADKVGSEGHTFTPATFHNARRISREFKAKQLFVLDFDGGITFAEVWKRCQMLSLPMAFAYKTFSWSAEREKFRVGFLYQYPITDTRAANIIQAMFMEIFPECDKSCSDLARMFFGGKGALYINDEVFSIMGLNFALSQWLQFKDKHNFRRTLLRFASRNHVSVCQSFLNIRDMSSILPPENEEIVTNSIYIYSNDGGISSDSAERVQIILHDSSSRGKVEESARHNGRQRASHRKDLDLGMCVESCELLRDFFNGDIRHGSESGHYEKLRILSNLRFIRGGTEAFLRQIKREQGDISKWKLQVAYFKENPEYDAPFLCNGAHPCRYADECPHKKTILATCMGQNKVIRKEKQEYVGLEDAYRELERAIDEAITSDYQGIYVIKAQTALGKTKAYIDEVCRHVNKNFVLAVPTVKLKQEVAGRMRYRTDCYETPSISEFEQSGEEIGDMCAEIRSLCERGVYNQTAKKIGEYLNRSEDTGDTNALLNMRLKEILSIKEDEAKARVVLTTHAHLLSYNEEFLKDHTVIIDEDILSEYLVKQTKQVSMRDIEECVKYSGTSGNLRQVLVSVMKAPLNSYVRLTPNLSSKKLLKEDDMKKAGISGDVNDLAKAAVFVKTVEESASDEDDPIICIHYFYPRALSRGKYVVLSATVDPEIYKLFFKNLDICGYREIGSVKYKGQLKQYTAKSLGRRQIDEVGIENLSAYAKEVAGASAQIISFMKYDHILNNSIHFGNLTGLDCFGGRDIAIIGTPFMDDVCYKLPACYLDETMDVAKDKMRLRWVEYNGYKFKLMSYENEVLRRYQLYTIRDQLEQAVGRARLLRNDVTVALFSAFPCEQAIIIQEDYLRDIM